jgi:hypothetical protein
MKINILILLIFFGLRNCQSQTKKEIERQKTDQTATLVENPKIQVEIHSRVDTTKNEIKEIATLWINYLNSKPDSLYDNPYWNNAEKIKFKKFDLSTPYMYQFPSKQLLNYYKPTILSIEKEDEHYGIRTIFSAEGLEGEYRKSNPWCITKLYAVKEDGKWRLKNALPIITDKWNKKTVGKITFIYPPHHKFNNDLATTANLFCSELTKQFKFPEWEPFDFYITDSADELGKLLNFDFYSAGYTTGIGMNDHHMLLSGLGSEYYPHEFIHLIVPKQDRHWMIEEGFATWKGGQGEKTFEESAGLLANELAKNHTVSFSDILNKKWGWQFSAFYTTGAILCNLTYEKGGVELLNELLKIPNDNEKLIDNLCLIFKIEKKEFDPFWRIEMLKFRTN